MGMCEQRRFGRSASGPGCVVRACSSFSVRLSVSIVKSQVVCVVFTGSCSELVVRLLPAVYSIFCSNVGGVLLKIDFSCVE